MLRKVTVRPLLEKVFSGLNKVLQDEIRKVRKKATTLKEIGYWVNIKVKPLHFKIN